MPNEPILGLQLQPVTVQIDGIPHEMHYGASEPEYVGALDSLDDLLPLSNLTPEDYQLYGGSPIGDQLQPSMTFKSILTVGPYSRSCSNLSSYLIQSYASASLSRKSPGSKPPAIR
jgi:hypothetical protein